LKKIGNRKKKNKTQNEKDEEKSGDRWTGSIIKGRDVKIRVDWSLCMGSSSCVTLAPKLFKLDWEKKKSFFDPAPLELMDDGKSTDPTTVFLAAQSCPYRAIIVEDEKTGEQLYP
jgi:ferredoxin